MNAEAASSSLVDRFGRVHDSVRVSVTDRCNIRCSYCMPEWNAEFMPKGHLLTFEEIERLVQLMVRVFGVSDVRLTGGEPLVRRDIVQLVEKLANIKGLQDLSLTTNGILLADHADALRQSGLQRLNISLDTLDEQTFQRITRRSGLDKVIAGVHAAMEAGFESIKLNALAIQGVTGDELERLLQFALDRGCVLRFIEWMPLDADRRWNRDEVLSGDEILSRVEKAFGPVEEVPRDDASRPAERFRIQGGGEFGIIRSVTRPFCGQCNRIRLTADGALRNCLFSDDEFSLRDPMRDGATDEELADCMRRCVAQKRAGHGIDDEAFLPPDRAMYSIGG